MPSRPAKSTGIRRTATGWRAWVWIDDANRSKRFPADTPLSVIQAWRAQQRALSDLAHPDEPKSGFAADVRRYLAIIDALPGIATRTQQLEDWVAVLGKERDRTTVTTAEIAGRLALWQAEYGYAASTLNHYRHALAHLYRTLDPSAPNPARGVRHFTEPQPEPRGMPPYVVEAILLALSPRDVKGRGSAPSRTAAQMRVLATTGLPPASIGRLTQDHLATLDQGCVLVPGRHKGKGTRTARHALTRDGVAALKAMAAVGAWGPIPSSTRLIVWRRAVAKVRADHPDWGIPEDARPYDLRHSFAEVVYRATHDLALTQGLLGHADQRTTRRYASGAIPEGEAAAAKKVSLLWRASAPPKPPRRKTRGPA